jgi:hypothetical protein
MPTLTIPRNRRTRDSDLARPIMERLLDEIVNWGGIYRRRGDILRHITATWEDEREIRYAIHGLGGIFHREAVPGAQPDTFPGGWPAPSLAEEDALFD